MSRVIPDRESEQIFEAVDVWKKKCLLGKSSIFSDKNLWTGEHLDSLSYYFVDNPDEGEGTFMERLERQLAESAPEVKLLTAELTWFMLICPTSLSTENKRDTVSAIWSWAGQGQLDSGYLKDEYLIGFGKAGAAFNTLRWMELRFGIAFLREFRKLEQQEASDLLLDAWKFDEWLSQIPEADSRQLRHMILYLLFPDTFERIFGNSHYKKIVSVFTDHSMRVINKMSVGEINRELYKIRTEKVAQYPGEVLDFYTSPLREIWFSENDNAKSPKLKVDSVFAHHTKEIERTHVLSALEEIDSDGIPKGAQSSTYDLVHKGQRYPPKYVLSLASKHAMGEEFSREQFSGGKDSQAFKVLAGLGFHIERKELVRELVADFIGQANDQTSLATSNYPKEYRGLKIIVSFGQGNYAKIPWVAFTGFEQRVMDGIYPVLLYYKEAGQLLLAYGVSETNKPTHEWLADSPTIYDYFLSHGQETPSRYSQSILHTAFEVESIDYEKLEISLDEVISDFVEMFGSIEPENKSKPRTIYSEQDALEGLFLPEDEFFTILETLKSKKNIILQGPPGVGKSFLCKRIAFALMGERAVDRLSMIQFHQSYSYEDFVQGYRPSKEGFARKNGIFYEFCIKARNDPSNDYVFIVDEINRGNLSKIFGELMLLIENDKRGEDWQMPLTYSENSEDLFYVPENLYFIGLMNTADRSIAVVDYALRRRFVFLDLKPQFDSEGFQDHLVNSGMAIDDVDRLVAKMSLLNQEIENDATNLGKGYCIGHSFFSPTGPDNVVDWSWYQQVIHSEIKPLLEEYYFDELDKAGSLVDLLLSD